MCLAFQENIGAPGDTDEGTETGIDIGAGIGIDIGGRTADPYMVGGGRAASAVPPPNKK